MRFALVVASVVGLTASASAQFGAGGDTAASATFIGPATAGPPSVTTAASSTTGFTNDFAPTVAGNGNIALAGLDVFYTFTVTIAGSLNFSVSTTDSNYDPAIYVYNPGLDTQFGGADAATSGGTESLSINSLAVGDYVIGIDSKTGSGAFALTVTAPAAGGASLTPVPEPTTVGLLATAGLGLAGFVRRRFC